MNLIPSLTSRHCISYVERELVELSLGISNPQKLVAYEFQNSRNLTASETQDIMTQDDQSAADTGEIRAIRNESANGWENRQKNELQHLMESLWEDSKRKVD